MLIINMYGFNYLTHVEPLKLQTRIKVRIWYVLVLPSSFVVQHTVGGALRLRGG
jgi:hypothetical protein